MTSSDWNRPAPTSAEMLALLDEVAEQPLPPYAPPTYCVGPAEYEVLRAEREAAKGGDT